MDGAGWGRLRLALTERSGKSARVSKKIEILRREGVPQKQAIATALSMEREHRIRDDGSYVRESIHVGNRSRSYVLRRLHDYVQGSDGGSGMPDHNQVRLGYTPSGHEVPGLAARVYNDLNYKQTALLGRVMDRYAGTEPQRSEVVGHMRAAFPGWSADDHRAAAEGHRNAALDAEERREVFAKAYAGKRFSPVSHGRYVIAHKQLETDHANHLRIAAAHENTAAHLNSVAEHVIPASPQDVRKKRIKRKRMYHPHLKHGYRSEWHHKAPGVQHDRQHVPNANGPWMRRHYGQHGEPVGTWHAPHAPGVHETVTSGSVGTGPSTALGATTPPAAQNQDPTKELAPHVPPLASVRPNWTQANKQRFAPRGKPKQARIVYRGYSPKV